MVTLCVSSCGHRGYLENRHGRLLKAHFSAQVLGMHGLTQSVTISHSTTPHVVDSPFPFAASFSVSLFDPAYRGLSCPKKRFLGYH
jgi:hypothetical protein